MKFAVIRTGGKQYIVHEGDEVVIDHLHQEVDTDVEFEKLAEGDTETKNIELGAPTLSSVVKGKVTEVAKGEKVRVGRYKAKVRYHKVRGFRALLNKVKITSI